MKNILKFAGFIVSISMLFFYAIYISDYIFGYMPFANYIGAFLDNIIYFGSISVCALFSLYVIWDKVRIIRWIVLAGWLIIIVASFFPGSILDLFR